LESGENSVVIEKMKNFKKQTQERQETQETHVAIFYIPLFSFALRKGVKNSKYNRQKRQNHQNHQKRRRVRSNFFLCPR
jgi:hypothetical protein